MRADRIIPPRAGIDTALPIYGNGFDSPLTGNPRSVPSTKDVLSSPGSAPPAQPASQPGAGIGASLASSTTGFDPVEFAKKNWMWLIVGGLVVAACVVK